MTTNETTIGINGVAHVMLTVSQFAAARAFYGRLLPALGTVMLRMSANWGRSTAGPISRHGAD